MGLDTVEIVLWAEKKYGLACPDSEVSNIFTVGEYASYLHHKLTVKNGFKFTPTYNEVYSDIKIMLIKDFAVKEQLIEPNARFINDLGLE